MLPQLREQERRRRYRDRDLSMPAPNKLIGYVSAGSIETPGAPRSRRPLRGRRRHVVLLAALLAVIRVFF